MKGHFFGFVHDGAQQMSRALGDNQLPRRDIDRSSAASRWHPRPSARDEKRLRKNGIGDAPEP
jgi:hypothetical protein